MSILGDRLRELRGSSSQREMAEAVGIKYQAWDRYEKGKVSPGADILQQICRVHACSADWLLGLPSRGGSATVTAGKGAAVSLGSGNATASNCRDCPILIDFINRRSGGK